MFSKKYANRLGWRSYQYEQAISLLVFLGFISILSGVNPLIVSPLIAGGLFGFAFCMGDSFSLSLLMILSLVTTGLFINFLPVLVGGITFDALYLLFITLPWAWRKSKTKRGEMLLDIKESIK